MHENMFYVKKKTSGNEIYVGLNLKGLFLFDLSKMFFFCPSILKFSFSFTLSLRKVDLMLNVVKK